MKSLYSILVLSLLTVSCASHKDAKDSVKEEVAKTTVTDPKALGDTITETIRSSQSLTDAQKTELEGIFAANKKLATELGEESYKNRAVLIHELLAGQVDKKKVGILKKEIKKIEDLRLKNTFDTIDKISAIVSNKPDAEKFESLLKERMFLIDKRRQPLTKLHEVERDLKCSGCAAVLKFSPGTKSLKCQSCNTTTIIETSESVIEENSLEDFISQHTLKEDYKVISTVQCDGCGAGVTLKPNITSDSCPFCGLSLIIKNGTTSSILRPKSILPFKIKHTEAQASFKRWIKSLWFAPNALKEHARSEGYLNGMYIPYWTYDAATESSYSGQKGTNYTETESYIAYENGKSVHRTRTVTKVSWQSVSGNVSRKFDDVLVIASKSLSEEYARELEPWDLKELVPFDEKFLSGFRTESYQIDVSQGLPKAKSIMDESIRRDVCRDIGGDHQRISSLDTSYSQVTFKHTLLPIWISTYRFNDKAYTFLVNGRTGEVQGERPYSWMKIALLCITLAILAAFFMMNNS